MDLEISLRNERQSPILAVVPPPPLVGFKDLRFTDVELENPAGKVSFNRMVGWIPWPPEDRLVALSDYVRVEVGAALSANARFNLGGRRLEPGEYRLYLIYQAPSGRYWGAGGLPSSSEPLLVDCKVRSNAVNVKLIP